MAKDLQGTESFGKGRHVITLHGWEAHIFTWQCTCWSGIPSDHVGWGNAPYGQEQAMEQIEEHLTFHGQGKATRTKALLKEMRAAMRPLSKREQKQRLEERRGR